MEEKIIKTIKDEDVGLTTMEMNEPTMKNGIKGIIYDKDGRVALFYKNNKYKLPSFKSKLDEDNIKTIKREAPDKTGCILRRIKELGITIEEKSHANSIQKSYVYKASVYKDKEMLSVMQKDNDVKLLWLTPEDAIERMKISVDYTDLERKYNNNFILLRDISILEYYLNEK